MDVPASTEDTLTQHVEVHGVEVRILTLNKKANLVVEWFYRKFRI